MNNEIIIPPPVLPKIYASICCILAEIGAIGKNKVSEQQHFKYRGIDDVMNALQPMLAKYHVFVVPTVLEQHREDKQTKAGNASYLSIFKIKYTFYAEDGSFIEAVTVGESMDTGDKGSNKAMAIAFKYALFQVFCIPTEEMPDPDGTTLGPIKPATNGTASAPVAPVAKPAEDPEAIISNKAYNYLVSLIQDDKQQIIQDKQTQLANIYRALGYQKASQIKNKDYQKIVDEIGTSLPFDI